MEKQAKRSTQPLTGWGHVSQTGLRFIWIAIIGFILDQYTKYAVMDSFTLYESVQVLPFFNFTYVHNYGAAFSFLSDAGGWQRYFFTAIAAVVSCVIVWWLYHSPRSQRLLPVAFAFILGGAVGNLYDRLVHGYVIDFLHLYYETYDWPAFNIADSVIFIGAALLILDMFINNDAESTESTESTEPKETKETKND